MTMPTPTAFILSLATGEVLAGEGPNTTASGRRDYFDSLAQVLNARLKLQQLSEELWSPRVDVSKVRTTATHYSRVVA